MEKYNLFLDDIREPWEAGNYMLPVDSRKLYRLKEWQIVRNYQQFVDIILDKGIPEMISFDHDLADEHYAPQEIWDDPSAVQERMKGFTEKTGYDAAKWLVDHCIEKGLDLPYFLIHSMNPVGAENIKNYLDNFKRFQNGK